MAIQIVDVLRHAVDAGASDIHLKVGNVPHVRIDGSLVPAPFESLTEDDTETLAMDIMPRRKAAVFHENSEADFSFEASEVGRFRVNVFRQRGKIGIAMRHIRTDIPALVELGLPDKIRELVDAPRGLVLVTGPAGTGKTTTIASMIDHVNHTRAAHIVTMEDPIEIVHKDDRSIIDQREVGVDTLSYAEGLRHVLRQDPDVIFLGEIRDADSMIAAVQAAETGHLVISTLHTIDATETVNRVLDLFPAEHQREARVSFAGSLGAIVSQRLVPRADGKGRVPAVELLVNTGRVYDRIIDRDHTFWINEVIADGVFYGMQTFDQHLVSLVRDGSITEDDAKRYATNPHDLMLELGGQYRRG